MILPLLLDSRDPRSLKFTMISICLQAHPYQLALQWVYAPLFYLIESPDQALGN